MVGGALGIVFELLRKFTHNRFPISAVGFGLAFVITFHTSLSMGLGAILFWVLGRILRKRPAGRSYRIWIENQETLCAGAIAGGAIIGILVILLEASSR